MVLIYNTLIKALCSSKQIFRFPCFLPPTHVAFCQDCRKWCRHWYLFQARTTMDFLFVWTRHYQSILLNLPLSLGHLELLFRRWSFLELVLPHELHHLTPMSLQCRPPFEQFCWLKFLLALSIHILWPLAQLAHYLPLLELWNLQELVQVYLCCPAIFHHWFLLDCQCISTTQLVVQHKVEFVFSQHVQLVFQALFQEILKLHLANWILRCPHLDAQLPCLLLNLNRLVASNTHTGQQNRYLSHLCWFLERVQTQFQVLLAIQHLHLSLQGRQYYHYQFRHLILLRFQTLECSLPFHFHQQINRRLFQCLSLCLVLLHHIDCKWFLHLHCHILVENMSLSDWKYRFVHLNLGFHLFECLIFAQNMFALE